MNFSTETKNPLSNGRVIGAGIDPMKYHKMANEDGSLMKRGQKDFVMSRSELCEFAICPSRWINGYRGDSETSSTEWGQLIDCMVLEPEKFNERFAVTPQTYPDAKTGEPKTWNWNANHCKEWRDNLNGKIAVKWETFNSAEEAVTRLKSDKLLSALIDCSQKQVFVMAEYHDHETGLVVPIKTLIDLLPAKNHPQFGKSIADLKTSVSAVPRDWRRFVFECDYHTQAALYIDAYTAATNEERIEFRHVIQENFHPYETSRRILSSEFLELGRAQYLQALKRYCQCLESGEWPSYDDEGREVIEGWQLVQPEAWMIDRAA